MVQARGEALCREVLEWPYTVGRGGGNPPPPRTGCPPLCGPDTEHRNRESPGAPLAQPTKGNEGGVERER